jgi:hypothetical protein
MSEAFLERLSRFTPDAGRLDRDALLFAAGRGSARPNRGWKALVTLLAGSQALSLGLLWRYPTPSDAGPNFAVTQAPVPPSALEPPTSAALVSPGSWSARRSLLEAETEERPAGDVTFVESGAPLRVAGPLPSSLLN